VAVSYVHLVAIVLREVLMQGYWYNLLVSYYLDTYLADIPQGS
jgi:hypothetical protein